MVVRNTKVFIWFVLNVGNLNKPYARQEQSLPTTSEFLAVIGFNRPEDDTTSLKN